MTFKFVKIWFINIKTKTNGQINSNLCSKKQKSCKIIKKPFFLHKTKTHLIKYNRVKINDNLWIQSECVYEKSKETDGEKVRQKKSLHNRTRRGSYEVM